RNAGSVRGADWAARFCGSACAASRCSWWPRPVALGSAASEPRFAAACAPEAPDWAVFWALLEELESTTIGICVVSSVLSPVHFTAAKLPVEKAEARRSELGSLLWPRVGDPAEEAARADAPGWLPRAARFLVCSACADCGCPAVPVR